MGCAGRALEPHKFVPSYLFLEVFAGRTLVFRDRKGESLDWRFGVMGGEGMRSRLNMFR